MLDGLKQAVADVRRARDAAASLPLISGRVFGVQGTSLGGFVTSTAGGLDKGFDRVFILLAGGICTMWCCRGRRMRRKFGND